MYAKLLIKAAILLLVINIALIGVMMDRLGWFLVAVFNLIAIFVLLFQERSVFQTISTPNKRILFTTDVFGWIAVGVGVIIAGLSQLHGSVFPPILCGFLGAGLFYVLTVAIFNLSTDGYRKDSGIRVIGTIVILLMAWFLAQWFGLISANSLGTTYDKVVGRWQHTLQSIVVDKDIALPEGQGGVTVTPPDTTMSGNDSATGNTDTMQSGSDVGNTIDQNGRIFDTTTRAKSGELTYGSFLPVLFDTFNIAPTTNNYAFTNIDRDSPLYPSFALARDYTMIGSKTDPASIISCQTLMVLLGLAQDRNLGYTSLTVLDVFRAEAQKQGYTAYACNDRTQTATWADLP